MNNNNNFMIIAHRGASAYAPENTPAAFSLALEMGAGHIELDVHLSSDGQVVVIHDAAVDRTTNGSGPVAGYTLAELRKLDAGSWFAPEFGGERIPTLAETLELCRGRARLHVEIKGAAKSLVPLTLDCIRQGGMAADVTITSFDINRLKEARADDPGWSISWLVKEITGERIDAAHSLGLRIICPAAACLTPEQVERLHNEGFNVRTWGVKTEEDMRRLVEWGVDGMTVDFPDKLIAFMGA